MSLKTVLLGSVCYIEKGNIGILKAIPGEYPMVVTGEERKSHNEYQFDTEAVLIPLVSGTGHGHASIKRLHYQTGKFALGSILCAVIPKNKTELSAEYLFRYLSLNKDNELVARMKGMANVTLPMKEIAKIEIPLPSLAEQLNFIEKYKQLETQSELLSMEFTHQLDLVKQLRQSFLREAMQGKLVVQNPADGNAKDLLEQIKAEKAKSGKKEKTLPAIKEEEIPFEIPESWVWCRLGELCNYGSSLKAEPKDIVSETWVLDLEDIEKESSKLISKIRYSERKSQSTKSIFYENEVLYSKLRPYLDKVIVADENGVCTTEILPLRFYADLNPYFLRFALKRKDFINYVTSITKGMKMPRLGTSDGQKALVPLPPLPEQQRIVEKLDELMQMCDELEQSIKASQEQNEKLLQQVLREALRG